MAAAVRRLIALTVTADAPPEVLAGAADRAHALADQLESHVPEPGDEPTARYANRTVEPHEVERLASAMPFDVIIGSCNPLALPIDIEFDPPRALGSAVFTAPYEGAPGCVHGAVLAGAFDIMLTAANVVAGGAGPTVRLTIRYLKPTILGIDTEFESEVTEVTDRRTYSVGRLIQDGVVKVEATGEFVNLSRERINAMHRDRLADGRGAGD